MSGHRAPSSIRCSTTVPSPTAARPRVSSAATAQASSTADWTAQQHDGPSLPAATSPIESSSPTNAPPSPPATDPARCACPRHTKPGKPDDHQPVPTHPRRHHRPLSERDPATRPTHRCRTSPTSPALRAANAHTIAVGHGRHPASVRAGDAIAAAWTRDAGTVQSVVSWPADAASRLRPACRLTAADPDAVVVADTAAGFAQLARRLASQAGWSANRTIGFASLANADLIALTGTTLTGMTGATTTGNTWLIGHELLILGDQP